MISFRDRDFPTSILWLTKFAAKTRILEANFFLGLAYLYREQYERAAAAFRVVEQQLPLNEATTIWDRTAAPGPSRRRPLF